LAAAFGFASLAAVLRVVKWAVLVNVSVQVLAPIQMVGIAISNMTPGRIAEPLKALLLRLRTGTAVSHSLPSIVWERVFDVTVLLLLSTLTFGVLANQPDLRLASLAGMGLFGVMLAFTVAILRWRPLGERLFRLIRRLPGLHNISPQFVTTFYSMRIGKWRLVAGLLVTFGTWLAEGMVLFTVVSSLGGSIGIVLSLGLMALATTISIASALPGGLGSFELIATLLLGVMGVELGLAAAAVLLYRLLSYWYTELLGAVCAVWLGNKISLREAWRMLR
jgi:uncharacterized protein (TIRG00374 family)